MHKNEITKEIDRLRATFREAFPDSPDPKVCRAPGRINLIGEHLDYNGLPVLPMTIDREIRIAFAPRTDNRVRVHSVGHVSGDGEFENGPEISPSRYGSWENYCKAALAGLNAHFNQEDFPGMDMVIKGTIPVASGLSSSSAMVVANSLAYLSVLGKGLGSDITRIELASLLAEAEQYVGTRGGGMDQAIILLGGENSACRIDFFPLRADEIPLFDDYVFVACNSLVRAEKTGEALHRYNEGPLTCRLIRALVEKQAQQEFGEEITFERLGDLWFGPLCLTSDEVRALFDATFPEDTMTLGQAAVTLGMTVDEIRAAWLSDLREPEGGFRLKDRAAHQLSEYGRVESARDMAVLGAPLEFGRLMNESHASCAADYHISCDELDALVGIARDAGSVGSRLTGAGFGGCTVNLVPRDKVDSFREEVQRKYYEEYLAEHHPEVLKDVPACERILVVQASAGADYIE